MAEEVAQLSGDAQTWGQQWEEEKCKNKALPKRLGRLPFRRAAAASAAVTQRPDTPPTSVEPLAGEVACLACRENTEDEAAAASWALFHHEMIRHLRL